MRQSFLLNGVGEIGTGTRMNVPYACLETSQERIIITTHGLAGGWWKANGTSVVWVNGWVTVMPSGEFDRSAVRLVMSVAVSVVTTDALILMMSPVLIQWTRFSYNGPESLSRGRGSNRSRACECHFVPARKAAHWKIIHSNFLHTAHIWSLEAITVKRTLYKHRSQMDHPSSPQASTNDLNPKRHVRLFRHCSLLADGFDITTA